MTSIICLFELVHLNGHLFDEWVDYAVPTLRSDFPDFGQIPDFFHESGPETVRIFSKSPDSR